MPAPLPPEAPFGTVLRELRRSRGMSTTELARAVGVSQPTVMDYEDGTTYPRLPTLYRVVRALGAGREAVYRLVAAAGWEDELEAAA